MDDHKVREDGALVMESAAMIVQGSIECGMIGDLQSIAAARIAAEFLRQHAEWTRTGCLGGDLFRMALPAEVR
jgi:hypothetical protein